MNKTELIAKIAEKMTTEEAKMTKKAAGECLDAVVEVITEAMVAGEDVKIAGFGTFTVVERSQRQGRNPQTGEAITIEASRAPKFKASSTLKAAIKEA